MSSAEHLALSATDESVHLRPRDAPDTWQENCFVMGYDESRDLSVYFHVERLADRFEIKAAAGRGDAITWAHSNDDAWPEVVVPFEHLRLEWASEQVGFELELRSEIPAIDHAEALMKMGLPGAERDHYEAVGRLLGRIEIDGGSVDFDGLFWRDHTWGAREYAQFGASWWWPTCLDGGRAYVSGVAVDVGDRVLGYGLVADENGVAGATEVRVEVQGQRSPGEYTGVTVEYEPAGRDPVRLVYTPRHHLCTTFPSFNVDRQWNDAFSLCTWGDRQGYGSIELGI
jgi:predicted secreted hydrolase